MKTKKPARIKGRVMYTSIAVGETAAMILHERQSYIYAPSKVIVLPIDNPDALVEQASLDLAKCVCKGDDLSTWQEVVAVVLRSIGVPLKKDK